MSKALRIPTNGKEITEWFMQTVESAQKRGIRIYCLAGYSHMMSQDIVIGNPALMNDEWDFKEFIASFEDWLDLSYNLVDHWLGEKAAQTYYKALSDWLVGHVPRVCENGLELGDKGESE